VSPFITTNSGEYFGDVNQRGVRNFRNSYDYGGHIWDAESGKKIGTLTPDHRVMPPKGVFFTFCLPSDGKKYAVHISGDTTFIVSEFGIDKTPLTLAEQRTVGRGGKFGIDSIMFSPDGKKIVTSP